MSVRARKLNQLNQTLVKQRPEWALGVLNAANMVDEMYAAGSALPYLVGDCVLCKMNLISRRQIRRNPTVKKARP